MKFEIAYEKVCELVDDFEKHFDHYKKNFDEASTRKRFIDRFFSALGWAVDPDNKISPTIEIPGLAFKYVDGPDTPEPKLYP